MRANVLCAAQAAEPGLGLRTLKGLGISRSRAACYD
jgi:hypothetical protein